MISLRRSSRGVDAQEGAQDRGPAKPKDNDQANADPENGEDPGDQDDEVEGWDPASAEIERAVADLAKSTPDEITDEIEGRLTKLHKQVR